MVCYAPRLEPGMAPAARGSARAVPWMAPAMPWAESAVPWPVRDAPRARAPLFLVREALPVGDGYTALPPAAGVPVAGAAESEVRATALPEPYGDVLDALEEEIVVLSAHMVRGLQTTESPWQS